MRIRNARRDANKITDAEEKGGLATEDETKSIKDQIQELTKTYEGKVDEVLEHKKKEIMTV